MIALVLSGLDLPLTRFFLEIFISDQDLLIGIKH